MNIVRNYKLHTLNIKKLSESEIKDIEFIKQYIEFTNENSYIIDFVNECFLKSNIFNFVEYEHNVVILDNGIKLDFIYRYYNMDVVLDIKNASNYNIDSLVKNTSKIGHFIKLFYNIELVAIKLIYKENKIKNEISFRL